MNKEILSIFFALTIVFSGCKKEEEPIISTLNIGDFHEGGVIFHLDISGEHGLVVDIKNLDDKYWGDWDLECDAYQTGFGFGFQNTNNIISVLNEFDRDLNLCAAYTCNISNSQGYSNWYLPSLEELNKIFLNKEIIESQNGVIPFTDNSLNSNNNYWTSSEAEGAKALSINFLNGNTNANPKETINKVRAVRSF